MLNQMYRIDQAKADAIAAEKEAAGWKVVRLNGAEIKNLDDFVNACQKAFEIIPSEDFPDYEEPDNGLHHLGFALEHMLNNIEPHQSIAFFYDHFFSPTGILLPEESAVILSMFFDFIFPWYDVCKGEYLPSPDEVYRQFDVYLGLDLAKHQKNK